MWGERIALAMVAVVTAASVAGAFWYFQPDLPDLGRTDGEALTGGDPARGRQAFAAYGCVTCHRIAAVREARGLVGPPLDRIGARIYIAGSLPNTPNNMISWLRNPQRIVPGNAMPDMGLKEGEARDIAAFLYTQQ
jgi:cytochrome c2